MQKLLILDPSKKDVLSAARGGGRVMQMLRENLHEARFVSDLSRVGSDSALLIPFWKPFEAPIINKRMAQHQAL
ncbi:MAG: hypothetical protein ACE5DQ_01605, partial [Candidatus Paceibacterota bacterium]